MAGQTHNVGMASTVRCPICKTPVPVDHPDMPFCSDRCRTIDLGNWASEKYVISTPADRVSPPEQELEILEPETGFLQ